MPWTETLTNSQSSRGVTKFLSFLLNSFYVISTMFGTVTNAAYLLYFNFMMATANQGTYLTVSCQSC